MADSRLPALSEVSTLAIDDYLYLVDKSDTTDDATGSSRRMGVDRLGGFYNPAICNGRLTLVTGVPIYTPGKAQVPSSTDTSADTCTFSTAHGWVSGTVVYTNVTVGGLTLNTSYYVNAASSTAVSFHTNVADAIAGTSKVNLTASITGAIIPLGVGSTNIYFTPYNGNRISVYDGTRWELYTFSELTLAVGTLTASLPYDIFVYDNAGTLTLEATAWTDGTTRATDLALQDGIYCKSGALTRRYLGTFYTASTTTAENRSDKLWLWNLYNQEQMPVSRCDHTTTWTYTTATYRQANSNTANQIDVVVGLTGYMLGLTLLGRLLNNNAGVNGTIAIGRDSTTVSELPQLIARPSCPATSIGTVFTSSLNSAVPLGRHYYAWLEQSVASGTCTWYGANQANPETLLNGFSGVWLC